MLSLLHSLSEQQEKLGLDGIFSLQLQQSHSRGAPEGAGSYGKLCQLSGCEQGPRIQPNEWEINISAPKCRVKGWEL